MRYIDLPPPWMQPSADSSGSEDSTSTYSERSIQDQPLLIAVRSGNLDEVRSLILHHQADIHATTTHRQESSLHIAVERGHFEIVEFLLNSGADHQATASFRGEKPLHTAARTGHVKIVQVLLKYGADHEAQTSDQETPLHIAAKYGHIEVAEALLNSGANVQAAPSSRTPLHQAAQFGQVGVVEVFLRHGADVMARDLLGQRPLDIAVDNPYGTKLQDQTRDDVALVLLKNMTEEQALQQGANAWTTMPLLWRVVVHNCIQCFHWILRYSTTKEVMAESWQGKTLLYEAIRICHDHDSSEMVMVLLDLSAPIRGISRKGDSALHHAAGARMLDVVKRLLQQDNLQAPHEPPMSEALKMRNSLGQTPLECACACYKPAEPIIEEIVTILLRQSHISDPRCDVDEDWTSLHWAVFYNRADIVSILVSKGADVKARDSSQRTPLGLAESVVCPANRQEILQWLLLKNIKIKGRELGNIFSLTRPNRPQEIEKSLGNVPFYMADIYRGGSMETSEFTIRTLLYEFGPLHITGVMKNVANNVSTIRDNLTEKEHALCWIHLPANNHLAQTLYYEKQVVELYSPSNSPTAEAPSKGISRQEYFRPHDDDQEDQEDQEPPDEFSSMEEVLYSALSSSLKQNSTNLAGSVGARVPRPLFKHIRLSAGRRGPTGMTPIYKYRHSMALSMPFLCFKRFGSLTNLHPSKQLLEQYYARDETMYLPLTLDQYHYDTSSRSADKQIREQVIFRQQGHGRNPIAEDERLICMVDHLWVHVLDDQTIVTSCSGSWDETEPSATTNIQRVLRDQLLEGKDIRPPLRSPLGMIPLAIATCIRESMVLDPNHGQAGILHVFADAIARAANEEVRLFGCFIEGNDSHNGGASLTRGALDDDFTRALQLLTEVKDIIDELDIIMAVLQVQSSIMGDTFRCFDRLIKDSRGSEEFVYIPELVDFYRSYSGIHSTLDDINRLISAASRVMYNVNRLLDLRQKHANLNEAKWARQASEDTTRQGRTILVFTVVTIIFLPITFLSSLFALDITAFPHNSEGDLSYTPRWAFSWLVGMTVAVSLPLILIAFFVNEISEYLSHLKSRGSRQNGRAREEQQTANHTAPDHEKQYERTRNQNVWNSLLRKRTAKRGTASNV